MCCPIGSCIFDVSVESDNQEHFERYHSIHRAFEHRVKLKFGEFYDNTVNNSLEGFLKNAPTGQYSHEELLEKAYQFSADDFVQSRLHQPTERMLSAKRE